MNPILNIPSACYALLLACAYCADAKDIEFAGYTWQVRSGQGGPGPNAWDENNVWLDKATNLHLKISLSEGRWSCAEVTMRTRLGFGRYEFHVTGRLDRFDENVVLGLFNYPTREVGPDGTHEIDIEFAHWGNPRAPVGNYTVWPAANSLKQVTKSFRFDQPDEATTHRFTWGKQGVKFQSYRGLQDDGEEIQSWDYLPTDASERVSKQPMPVHINLWLFRGRPPRDGEEVEVIINRFRFTAEGQ